MAKGPSRAPAQRLGVDAADSLRLIRREEDETATHYVCRLLYYNIVMLFVPPGALIREAKIADMLGISKTPVHQAVALLEQVLLVDVRPQSATHVSRISYDLLRQSSFMRFAIEPTVFAQAAAAISTEDVARLWENVEQQRQTGDVYRFIELDNEFHRMVYAAAGKEYVWASLSRVSSHYDRVRHMGLLVGMDQMSPDEHVKLLQMLLFDRKLDAAAFEPVLQAHLFHFVKFFDELTKAYPDHFDLNEKGFSPDSLRRAGWLL